MVEKTVKIINPSGLHARPAALFVQQPVNIHLKFGLSTEAKKLMPKA